MRVGRRQLLSGASAILVLAISAGAAIQLERPVPAPVFHRELARSYTDPGNPASLPWPTEGQAALYLTRFGWLGSTASEVSVPIASVTKIMTALVILRTHPLTVGMSGPTIGVSATAYSVYQSEVAAGDSVVRVETGETLSEFQLLEGLLLPSGDNLAVILADWQSGSEPAFVQLMNQLASALHLTQTHFTDSSGLDTGSVSSARDLVLLATVAMKNPVFAAVVAMPSVTLPVAGTVHNYNPILGQYGVIGIKTGWTSAAMGCLVFAANLTVAGQSVQLIGAVLGQPGGPQSGLVAAGRVATTLLAAGAGELQQLRLPAGDTLVGRVTSGWAGRINLQVTRSISLVGAAGADLGLRLQLRRRRAPWIRGAEVGSLTVTTPGGFRLQEPVVMARKLAAPSWWWRLTRPF